MPEIWAEIWKRPGHATFGRSIDEAPVATMTWHDGMNLVGDGALAIAESFGRFDEILKIDQTTPANSVKSLVRLFSEDDATTPFFEWLPSSILPTTDKLDPNVDVAGKGIKSVLSHARIEPLDWDGSVSFVPNVPDWVIGGPNSLVNPGLEESPNTPLEYELLVTATGGTFTITDGVDTTDPIAFDASAPTIKTRIQDDLAAFTTVVMSEQGGIIFITYILPNHSPTIALNVGLLTGGTATLTVTQDGGLASNPWTIAGAISADLSQAYGFYQNFGVSDVQAHTGSLSLLVDPGTVFATQHRNPGAQQILTVTPGSIFQASVWVYPTSGTDEFRLGIFGIGEELIAFDANDASGGTYPVNQWSQITISDALLPTSATEVIFRLQCTNGPSDPSVFYIDDAIFQEGLAATDIGDILTQLYDDATTNHAERLVWEDEANPGTPYLTLDFGALDSAGNVWAHSDIELKLWLRMTYLQVMTQIVNTWGYEWRIVPDDVEAGTWLWQVYNPGGMTIDYTAAAFPAIQGGAEDVRRSIARVLPNATDHLVEGLGRITARYRDTALESALGLIEGSRLDRELPNLTTIFDAAFEDSLAALTGGVTYVYDLTDPGEMPLVAYLVGDLLTIHDPPEVEDEARLIDVIGTATAHQVIIGVQFAPATEAGS
jgi:hypothetical protein